MLKLNSSNCRLLSSTDAMVGASTQVFAIAELMEMILLEVDRHALLVAAQRVSKQWHEHIAHSPVLQMALFFMPDPSSASASRHTHCEPRSPQGLRHAAP